MIDKKTKEKILQTLGHEGDIYPIKKYLKRKSDEKKPVFAPCYLVVSREKTSLIEIENKSISRILDVTGKVNTEKQKKFESGPFSYKIGKKLSD